MVGSPRFVPDRDLSDRRVHIPPSTVRYSDLTQSLKDKIAETDPTEHELLAWIVIQEMIGNLHRMKLSNVNIEEIDVDWP
jgi:hypothetical protein